MRVLDRDATLGCRVYGVARGVWTAVTAFIEGCGSACVRGYPCFYISLTLARRSLSGARIGGPGYRVHGTLQLRRRPPDRRQIDTAA